MTKKQQAVVEVDYLAVVRAKLATMKKREREVLAVGVQMSPGTVDNIAKGTVDSQYSNILKLYDAIKRQEAAAGA